MLEDLIDIVLSPIISICELIGIFVVAASVVFSFIKYINYYHFKNVSCL